MSIPDHSQEVPLVASIDVGTTSSRVILFNMLGQEVSKHQIEYSTSASKEKFASVGARRFSVDGNSSPGAGTGTAGAGTGTSATESRLNSSTPIFSAEGIAIEATEFLEIEDLEGPSVPTLSFPRPGWVECNPIGILAHVVQCFAANLISMNKVNSDRISSKLAPYRIQCIGIANMRETTLVWSKKTGAPIVNYGIVWNDTRTTGIVTEKRNSTPQALQDRLRAKTGLPLYSTYFSCSKLRWMLDNEPAVRDAYENGDLMFGTVDTWLLYHLTSNHAFVSDITNASRTGFMNLDTLDYDDELLKYWDISRDKIHLPKIVSSAEYYGDFTIPECIKTNLTPIAWSLLCDFTSRTPPVPIQGCLGDQSASLVGQLAFKPGAAKCTYGTGCFLLYNTGAKKLISNHGALTTFGYWFPHLEDKDHAQPHFALEGSVAVAGAVVQWLRDNLRLIPKAEDIGPLASRVNDSGGVVFVPAFSGLFAPYWDASARATIMGMSQHTTASHLARAAVEGVCFQARAILKAMSSDAAGEGQKDRDFLEEIGEGTYEKSPLSMLAVDGGMSRSKEVMQIQADILGPCVTVRTSSSSECTALGAAIAAALAYEKREDRKLWKDLKDVKKWIMYGGVEPGEKPKDGFEPPQARIFRSKSLDTDRRRKWKLWEAAIERCRGWTDIVEDGVNTMGNNSTAAKNM
ncbi:LANO_0F09406g1_1 [Lachancea nothofagi CBS 11611]|uniref:glycerol kinase n=1 Tax=Lachancea nothofagi CBS 11611 TaxID=1266666 RepID=A0A1G4K9Y9_9SACH|nr:LANO_0F09406g1_1 [Lachancea nothofagi CBS 11611]